MPMYVIRVLWFRTAELKGWGYFSVQVRDGRVVGVGLVWLGTLGSAGLYCTPVCRVLAVWCGCSLESCVLRRSTLIKSIGIWSTASSFRSERLNSRIDIRMAKTPAYHAATSFRPERYQY